MNPGFVGILCLACCVLARLLHKTFRFVPTQEIRPSTEQCLEISVSYTILRILCSSTEEATADK
jgi:hypothetical protein